MEYSQYPPSKIDCLAESSTRIGPTGLVGSWEMAGEAGGSPPVGLTLELGRGSSSGHGTGTALTKSNGFTIFQLQELHLQHLIYKYIEAGFPVPGHLVLPIWKSVLSSLGGINGLYQLYPSFLGISPLQMEYRNGMDPEPGRCRRTDGKKWRCSKEAIPNHKYCERHMHRGRQQRSRKLVEAAAQHSTNLSISLPARSSNLSSRIGVCTQKSE